MYTPLPHYLYIKLCRSTNSPHGYGLFTKIDLEADTNLGVSHIYHNWAEDGWIRTPLGGFYIHSEVPNCDLRDLQLEDALNTRVKLLYTITDIKRGQELTCLSPYDIRSSTISVPPSTTTSASTPDVKWVTINTLCDIMA